MRRKFFLIITLVIAGCITSLVSADQELNSKAKKSSELNLKSVELEYCQSKVAAIVNGHQKLKKKIEGLEKCYLDNIDSEPKTIECYRLSLNIKEQTNDFAAASIPSCSVGNFDTQSFNKSIAAQKKKISELSDLILRNIKVLDIKEINKRLNATLPELLKNVDKMDCDIDINHTGSLITKHGIALVKAKINGDYHTMKQIILKILALKTRFDLVVKKCNADKNDPYIVDCYKRVADNVKFFEKIDINQLLKVACKDVIKLNPVPEIVLLCEQGIASDYFFSTLNDLLSRR